MKNFHIKTIVGIACYGSMWRAAEAAFSDFHPVVSVTLLVIATAFAYAGWIVCKEAWE